MPNDWMIYGREKGKKRFRAFDGSGFTDKLMFALRFPPDKGDEVAETVAQLNRDNPDFEFQARRGIGTIFGDKPKDPPKDDRVQRDFGVALITYSEREDYVVIRFRKPPSDDALAILTGNGFIEGPKGVWKSDYDEVSQSVAERAAELTEALPARSDAKEGDYAIYGRQWGIGRYRPFDGKELGSEPMRWPYSYRQTVMSIAESLGYNNSALEFEVRQLPDTVYDGPIDNVTQKRLDGRKLRDLVIPVPHWGSFDRPDPPKDVPKLDTFPDSHVIEPVDDFHIDYPTQVFDMELVTEPIQGKRTVVNKTRAIDAAVVEISRGNATIVKSSIENGVYYAVIDACNPDLGACQRILVTGKVVDAPNGGVRTYLLQSDTGSPFLDCPRSYLKLLDEPRTIQDECYRRMVSERYDGDGRPWEERRYVVSGKEYDADGMVDAVSETTGLTPWQVKTTRDVRAMRVHDEIDVSGTRLSRVFNRKARRSGR